VLDISDPNPLAFPTGLTVLLSLYVPPFSPKRTFPDIQVYQTVKGVIGDHDALIELFESIEQF
jgi:hypothetical protein